MIWSNDMIIRFVEVLLAGGVGMALQDTVKAVIKRRSAMEPDARRITEQEIMERALINIGKANEELTGDITRVRAELSFQQGKNHDREEWWQSRWDEREDRWNSREAEMQQEIDNMRQKMVDLIQELDEMRLRFQEKLV